VASGLVLTVVTYLLLASALARRDHDLIFSALDRYATTYELYGLGGLRAAVSADRLAVARRACSCACSAPTNRRCS